VGEGEGKRRMRGAMTRLKSRSGGEGIEVRIDRLMG